MENYHKIKDYLSYSALKNYLRSPKYFKYAQENPVFTEAMNFGSAFHTYILEPVKFQREYYCVTDTRPEPEKNLTIKVNKDWHDNHKKQAILQNKIFLNADDYNTIIGMAREMSGNPVINELLTGGIAEQGLLIDNFNNVKFKIKPDYLTENYIVDLKTTGGGNSRYNEFQREVEKYHYYMQAAIYIDIMENEDGLKRDFYFVVVETTPPYLNNVFRASADMIEAGRYLYRELIKLHKYCVKNNNWAIGNEIFHQEIPELIASPRLKNNQINLNINN